MDRNSAFSWTVIILLVAAYFYPPLAALVGEGIRVLIGLGASFAAVYLGLRHPWQTAYIAVCIAIFICSILVAYYTNIRSGSTIAMLSWMASIFIFGWVLSPLLTWLDQKERDAKRSQQ